MHWSLILTLTVVAIAAFLMLRQGGGCCGTGQSRSPVSDSTISTNQEKVDSMTIASTSTMTKDPVCGMSVDSTTSIQAERDGKTFYFCGEKCREKFLSLPKGTTPDGKAGGCCQ